MFTNFILIQLIYFNSPKNLGEYLMIYIACFELAYGCLELGTVPDMYTQDSAVFVMVDPKKSMLPGDLLRSVRSVFGNIRCSVCLSILCFDKTTNYKDYKNYNNNRSFFQPQIRDEEEVYKLSHLAGLSTSFRRCLDSFLFDFFVKE
ncbi:unnamed protein product [Caenorhabditis brenneri]